MGTEMMVPMGWVFVWDDMVAGEA